ncbi:FKBP-type peptidyl-prolyl cis-trans isomerase [Olivibacter sitiensis]|uniref:FKBP-type peptidyl-prolyl cis-trans isomerase n=1 Tax=Olivibacter sitiensis TaxID=376470 RepID=UPI000405D931|nr:FKBP-type peptidyl-prolyl cis-trans isomerase [Olivibacter sitiensis]
MKKSFFIAAIAALSMAVTSCQKFTDGAGGMKYKIIDGDSKEKIQEGDFISMGAIIKTEGDSTMYDSYEMGQPAFLTAQKPQFQGDLFTALEMLGEGDSAIFKLDLDTMTAKSGQPRPENLKGKYMIYTFKINKVIKKANKKDEDFNKEIETFFEGEKEKAKNSEAGKIESYLKKNKLDVKTTASGLKYAIEKEGEGAPAKVGDTIVVHYQGQFLGGKTFDTSIKEVAEKENMYNPMREPYEPMKLPIGVGAVVPGWDEGLMLLPKGTKATLVLPSKLGYGENGNQMFPPYTPLAFKVEIVNIIPQKAAAAGDTTKTTAPDAQ